MLALCFTLSPCPDVRQVIEAKTPNAMLVAESEDARIDNRCETGGDLRIHAMLICVHPQSDPRRESRGTAAARSTGQSEGAGGHAC